MRHIDLIASLLVPGFVWDGGYSAEYPAHTSPTGRGKCSVMGCCFLPQPCECINGRLKVLPDAHALAGCFPPQHRTIRYPSRQVKTRRASPSDVGTAHPPSEARKPDRAPHTGSSAPVAHPTLIVRRSASAARTSRRWLSSAASKPAKGANPHPASQRFEPPCSLFTVT